MILVAHDLAFLNRQNTWSSPTPWYRHGEGAKGFPWPRSKASSSRGSKKVPGRNSFLIWDQPCG